MMDALNRAREYLETCDEQYGTDRGNWRLADLCLAALVAEIEAAPAGRFEDVVNNVSYIRWDDDHDHDWSLIDGKTVHLLALDSGGAGEVGS